MKVVVNVMGIFLDVMLIVLLEVGQLTTLFLHVEDSGWNLGLVWCLNLMIIFIIRGFTIKGMPSTHLKELSEILFNQDNK